MDWVLDIKDYDELKRNCEYLSKLEEYEGESWRECLCLPEECKLTRRTCYLLEVLGRKEGGGIAIAGQFAWWNIVKAGETDMVLDFVNFFSCEKLLFELVDYGLKVDVEDFGYFFIDLIRYYTISSKLVVQVIDIVSNKLGFDVKNVLGNTLKKDGSYSKSLFRRFIRARLRLDEFKSRERESGVCAYCFGPVIYTRVKGSDWKLHECIRSSCCGVKAHDECFWGDVRDLGSCRVCGTSLEAGTGRVEIEFSNAENAVRRLYFRERERVPREAEVVPSSGNKIGQL